MKAVAFIAALVVIATAHSQVRITERQAESSPHALQESPETAESKSVLVAVGLSILLPGSGELYAENNRVGGYLMAADGALWLTYAGFVLQGNWIMDDARQFAGQHSGADFNGKDEQFEVNVGNFTSMDAYNISRLRNREFADTYSSPSFQWLWLQEGDRMHYRSMRIKSDQMHQASEFVIGALVVNRIISAFMAWRSAQAYNSTSRLRSGWHLEAGVQRADGVVHGLGLKLTASF
jgi:hypothetical protein